MRILWLAALAAMAAVGGCSDDEPAGPGPIAIDNLRAEFESANCDFEVRCTRMPDKATCKKVDPADYEILQLTADAVFGKVHYDPAAARTWVEAVRSQACQDTVAVTKALETAWDPVFVGTVAQGGACLVDDECAGTAGCDRSMCGGGPACCAGVCTPKPKHVPLGGDCSMDTCEDDAYCDTGTDGGGGGGGAPSAPVCKPRAGNGQPCQDQGGCADGQLCGNGKCYKLSPTGGACNPSLQFSCLEYDEWCDPASSKCVKLPASGQPCGMTGRHCRLYASCEGGTCTNRPSEGEPCGDMGPQCLGDLQCDGGACAKRPAVRVCVEADPPPMGGGGGMGGM